MKKNFSSSDIQNNPQQIYNIENNDNYLNNQTEPNINNLIYSHKDSYSNLNNINNISYNILEKQNQNLKNQIIILTKRIKEYENDYINNNNKKTNQLKEFSELEYDLNNQINKKNTIINSIQEENNYLKNYINQMDKDIIMLKNEVKNLLLIEKQKENDNIGDINNNINNNNINNQKLINLQSENDNINNNMIDLIKKYSNEIIYLKNQNANLINYLNIINNTNRNNIINEEISKLKIKQNEEKSKFEHFLNIFANQINEELFIISQWVETYLGNEYDKGYEIPSLMNDFDKISNNKINLINFDLIKSSLEKAVMQLNSIINNKETEIIKLNNIIKEKDNKYNEIKKELIKAKEAHIELNN